MEVGQIIQIGLAVSGACAWASAFTKTPKDDAFFKSLYKLLDAIGGNIMNAQNKDPHKEPK